MLLTEVFNWVVETSIMASILAILIIIIKYIFKNNLGAKWHYAIWGLLIIRLIIPISIESSLSIYNVFHPNIIEVQKPIQLSSNSGVSNYSLKGRPQKNIPQNSNTPAKVQDNNKVQYEDKGTNGFYYRLNYILPIIWLVGALILSLFVILQSIVFYSTVKNEILLNDETILKLLNDCKAILGIKRTIPIVKTNKVRTPCLFGVLAPKILIPESLLYEFSEENLKCIFLHELSHYKKKDILVNWISIILQAINWFNPIIWYSFRKMREDCELACDDYVLRHLVEKEREQYGLSIINLLSIFRSIWNPLTTGFFGNSKKQIIRRIKAIKAFKKANIKWAVITVAMIIGLGVTALTSPKINQTSSTNTKIQSSNSAKPGSSVTNASSVNNSNNDLLYGKYPDPILKVIGDNPDVQKDYKEVTSDDLNKIKSFAYYRNNGDYPDESFYGFEANKVYDFSILLDMPNMTELDISYGDNIRLKDYSILKQLKNLKSLRIGNISDSDIENITGLTSLTWLSIDDSKITNIEFLKNFKELTMFTMSNVPDVHNFKPLEYLNKIDQINLCNSNLTEKDLDTIPNIDSVTGIGLGGNSIKSINQFPQMNSLKYLVLENNPLTGINISSDRIPKIESLSLINTKVSDLNKLKGVENIQSIYLKGTLVTKLSPLKRYKNLKNIYADINNIKDIDQLKGTNITIAESE